MPQTNPLTSAQWLALADPADQIKYLQPPVGERKLRLFGCYCCRRCWGALSPEGREALETAEQFAEGLISDDQRRAAFRRLVETSGGHIGPHPPGRAWETAVLSVDFPARAVALVIATDKEFLICAETDRAIGETYEDIKQIRRAAESCRIARVLAQYEAQRQQDAARGAVSRAWNRLLRGGADEISSSVREQEVAYQAALVREIFGNPYQFGAFSPDWRTDTAVTLARQMYESRDFSAMPILADALQDAGCDNEDALNHCRDVTQAHVRGCWVTDLVLDKK
jgi:hypothetical protein